MYISPFSLQCNWKIDWRVSDGTAHSQAHMWSSQKEIDVLESVSKVGIISSVQLTSLLKGDKAHLKKMVATKKLIRHSLLKDKQDIPVFTLGPTAYNMIKTSHQLNEYTGWDIPAILRKLIFFQLYLRFYQEDSTVAIFNTKDPFTAGIVRNGKPMNFLIIRGNEEEINHYFKWEIPEERLLVIKESIDHISELDWTLSRCKVRLTTDADFKESLSNMFYYWDNGQWRKEENALIQNKIQFIVPK